MCYKILKATKMCESDHVLERRVCWRQCRQIPDHINLPTICSRSTSAPGHTVTFDTLLNTSKIKSANCVFCMSQLGLNHREKLAAVDSAKRDLQPEALRMGSVQFIARGPRETPSASEIALEYEQRREKARELLDMKQEELKFAALQLNDYIRDKPSCRSIHFWIIHQCFTMDQQPTQNDSKRGTNIGQSSGSTRLRTRSILLSGL